MRVRSFFCAVDIDTDFRSRPKREIRLFLAAWRSFLPPGDIDRGKNFGSYTGNALSSYHTPLVPPCFQACPQPIL